MKRIDKAIITCAPTGSIHTPSMSPYTLPVTAGPDRRAGNRRGPRPGRPSCTSTPATRPTASPSPKEP